MMKDIEKAEKELFMAQKKMQQQEETIHKLKKEVEAVRIQKKGLDSDLQQLIARREDIEQLQTTLV